MKTMASNMARPRLRKESAWISASPASLARHAGRQIQRGEQVSYIACCFRLAAPTHIGADRDSRLAIRADDFVGAAGKGGLRNGAKGHNLAAWRQKADIEDIFKSCPCLPPATGHACWIRSLHRDRRLRFRR